MSEKACTKCGETKPLEDFRVQRRSASGRHAWCKACSMAAKKVWGGARTATCSCDGCEAKPFVKGLCYRHWYRDRKYGDPRGGPTEAREPARWLAEVALPYSGDECLIWPFARQKDGYPVISHEGRAYGAHRRLCELVNGPPPTPQHQAAHGCGKGHLGCITNRHLRWATPAENCADKVIHGTNRPGKGGER